MIELLNLDDIAALYRCTRNHARDVITKAQDWPSPVPGCTRRRPLWLATDVQKYLSKNCTKTAQSGEFA